MRRKNMTTKVKKTVALFMATALVLGCGAQHVAVRPIRQRQEAVRRQQEQVLRQQTLATVPVNPARKIIPASVLLLIIVRLVRNTL